MHRRGNGLPGRHDADLHRRPATPRARRRRCARGQEHADAAWVVSTHETEARGARGRELTLSLQLRAPDAAVRRARGARDNGLVGDQALIDEVFDGVDSVGGGLRAARTSTGSRVESLRTSRRGRTRAVGRNVTVTLCGDRRGTTPMHRVAVGGRDPDSARGAASASASTCGPRRAGSESWRYESCFKRLRRAPCAVVDRIRAGARRQRSLRRAARRARPPRRRATPCRSCPRRRSGPGWSCSPRTAATTSSSGRARAARPPGLRPQRRAHAQLRRRTGSSPTTRSTASAAPTSATSSTSRTTIPDATVVKLEQNYRSTQTILDAANAVISHNRAQKPKSLWTDLGDGRPDQDPRARRRARRGAVRRRARSSGSSTSGASPRGDRGLLPDERAVAGAGGHARAPRDRLPGHRRHEVLRPRRDQGRDRVPDRARQPAGRHRVHRGSPTRPSAASAQTSLSRVLAPRGDDGHHRLGRRRRPGAVPGLGHGRESRRSARFMATMDGAARARRRERPGRRPARGGAARDRLPRRARGRADDRGAGPHREPRASSSRSRASSTRRPPSAAEDDALDAFLQQVALVADADTRSDDEGLVTLMTLHNAKGLEYPIVFMIGCEEGVFPHSPRARRGRPRGGAPPLLRRHHARDARPLPHLRAPARRSSARRTTACESRFLDEIPRRAHRPARSAARIRRGARRAAPSAAGASLERRRGARDGARSRASAWATTSSTPRSARAS